MTETRTPYVTAITVPWEMRPTPPPRPTRPDQIDILFLELQTGTIDMAAAARRVREIIGAAEVASANEAIASWVNDEPTALFETDYDRCPYCRAPDGACSH